jgi:IS5 family transposase
LFWCRCGIVAFWREPDARLRWRTGCEGRSSVSKRRHGLNRCRYRGDDGMQRWVGLGVIADNLINIGLAISKQSAK